MRTTYDISLMDHTSLSNAVIGARTCWDSFHKGGNYSEPTDKITVADKDLLKRLIFKHKHESIAEHIVYTFNIQAIPRFVLQELVRHRIASYSVKSSRYTLKELSESNPLITQSGEDTIYNFDEASNYMELHSNTHIAQGQIQQLEILRKHLVNRTGTIDELKYLLPESYLCDLVLTINFRSLRNLLSLRLSKQAHIGIRYLAYNLLEEIPNEHDFLFDDLHILAEENL